MFTNRLAVGLAACSKRLSHFGKLLWVGEPGLHTSSLIREFESTLQLDDDIHAR
jgi:hypothetical protein